MKVVFDVGKVLATAHMQWKDALAASGLSIQFADLNDKYLYDLPQYLPYEGGQISEEEYLTGLSNAFGLGGTEQARHLHRSIIGAEYEGIEAVIDDLHARGDETATLSNNNPIHWAWFTKDGPYPGIQKIQHLIASFQLGYFKPDPKIFQAFCEKTGWSPDELIFLDDAEKNIVAARGLGWNAEIITEDEPKAVQIRRVLSLS